MASFMLRIWDFKLEPSLAITAAAITGLVIPQARPKAFLEGRKT
jgi:hypothetical protein